MAQFPKVETLGYFHESLRDKTKTALRYSNNSGGIGLQFFIQQIENLRYFCTAIDSHEELAAVSPACLVLLATLKCSIN